MVSEDDFNALKAEVGQLKTKSEDEAHKAALDHAWAHFTYHANQRLVTFRYYLAVVAIFIVAYLKLMSDGIIWVSSVVASLGLVFSYVFLRLDLRNKDLVKLSEDVLIKEEENLQAKVGYKEINIIKKAIPLNRKEPCFSSLMGRH